MKPLSELKPFVAQQEMFTMPQVRIIGKAYCCFDRTKTPWETIREEFEAAQPILQALPRLVENAWIAWMGDSPKGSDPHTYMPAVICPADTPVPAGLDYRDLPASFVAKSEYGDTVNNVVHRFRSQGYATCYTDSGWNAQLYFYEEERNPPKQTDTPFRWLVPCVQDKKRTLPFFLKK